MSNEQKIEPYFPDINQFLCPEKIITFEEANRNYINALKKTEIAYNIKYANKLSEYQSIYNQRKIMPIKKDFSEFMSHMKSWKRKNNYNFSFVFQRRKKSYKKFNEKIRLFITTYLNSDSDDIRRKFSLDKLCDAIGIRLILILGKSDTHESVSMCYKILNEVNYFFTVKKGYLPLNAEPLIDLGFNPEECPSVIVPTCEEAIIPEGLEVSVKDYYKTPKSHSYQSLHVVYSSTQYGLPFEIQIRTMATHTRVEYITSMHDEHDRNRYPNPIHLDRPHINLYGYDYIEKQETDKDTGKVLTDRDTGEVLYDVEDFIGIEKSIDPFNLIY